MNLQVSASSAAFVSPSALSCCEPDRVAAAPAEPRARPDAALVTLVALIGGWAVLAAGTLAALGGLAALPFGAQ